METDKKITIAIDGHSSCGKSTLAKDLAKKIGYTFIDSGAMYRAITLFALNNNMISNGEIKTNQLFPQLTDIKIRFKQVGDIQHVYLNDNEVTEEIRLPIVSDHVSLIAKLDKVREKLVHEQREMGKSGGIIMDGRDIGTVVFPDAELKLFVTASATVRTERRHRELLSKGVVISKEDVMNNLLERDHIDSTREIGPLRQAADAVILDNSNLTRDEQLEIAIELVNERTKIFN